MSLLTDFRNISARDPAARNTRASVPCFGLSNVVWIIEMHAGRRYYDDSTSCTLS